MLSGYLRHGASIGTLQLTLLVIPFDRSAYTWTDPPVYICAGIQSYAYPGAKAKWFTTVTDRMSW